jgi:DNA-binding XRE family transcriptional regulator
MKIILKDNKGKLYAEPIPATAQLVGEIRRRGLGDTGALILMAQTGLFCQLNAGAIRSLDQREVYKEIVKAIREDAGQTQAEFAASHGVSMSSVAFWESGRRTPGFAQIKLLLLEAGIIKA